MAARLSATSSPDLAVNQEKVSASSPYLMSSYPDLEPSLPNLARSLPNLKASSPDLEERPDANGCLMTALLARPIIDDLSLISSSLRTSLEGLNFRNPDMNRDIS